MNTDLNYIIINVLSLLVLRESIITSSLDILS